MKFAFKYLFAAAVIIVAFDISASTQRPLARTLFLIHQQNAEHLGHFAKDLLIQKYGIPKNFIQLKAVKQCPQRAQSETLLHICIKSSGEHTVLQAQSAILNRAYTVFGRLDKIGQRGQ